jgi:hypothetical protein
LQNEQADQQYQSDRQHERRETGLDDGQTFHRRQHRNCRRNHRIAVEKRCRENPEKDDQAAVSAFLEHAGNQRDQRKAAALPLVVRPHENADVLDRDDQRHRPENQADDAEDVQFVDRQRVRADERFTESVDRAGTDVAEDDTDSAERQFRDIARAMATMPRCCGGCDRIDKRRAVSRIRCCITHSCAPSWIRRPISPLRQGCGR